MSRLHVVLVTTLIVAVPLTGCVTKKVPQPAIQAVYYPQCQTPFRELQEYHTRLQQRTMGYTLGGAAAGAATGALTGLFAANMQGALVGGVAGAFLGAAAGYTIAKIEEMNDEQQRLSAYQQLIGMDLTNATDVEIAALHSLKCYIQEFEHLQESRNAQRITAEEFTKRYSEIKAGVIELGKFTSNSQVMMTQRDMEMRSSLQKESGKHQSAVETFPTLDQRRLQRDRNNAKRNTYAQKQRVVNKRPKRSVQPQMRQNEGASSSLALAELKTDLDRLNQEARNDKARLQAKQQEIQPLNSSKKSHQFVRQVSMNEVTDFYDDYPEKVLQLEEVESKRKRALEIMDEAASKTGIGMV